MDFLIPLVVGIIIGWIAEWVIDWVYWRRGIEEFYANETRLNNALAASNAETVQTKDALTAVQAEAAQHSADLSTARGNVEELQAKLSEALLRMEEMTPAKKRDDLEQINGIGPVFEKMLFAAGIETYAQLAATSVEQLKEIINPSNPALVDFPSWIQQARRFAEVVVVDLLPYRLEEIRGIGPAYAKRLNEAGIHTFTDLAQAGEERLDEIIGERGARLMDTKDWIRQAKAFIGLTSGDRPPLPLEEIKGIGPVFATRLDLAGIHTFEDLAKTNVDQIREALGSRGASVANVERWLREANEHLAGSGAGSGAGSAVEEADAS